MSTRPPNVLYIHTHDTGRWVAPYGHAVPTPRLQSLAEEGVLFRRAFSAAPTCSPSRAALLTGQSAHSAGMFGLAHMGFRLNDYRQHLVHTLHDHGFTTAMVGVQHVAPGPDEGDVIGYHEHLRTDGIRADSVVPAAVEYLSRRHDVPFFLSVGLVETHTLAADGSTFGYPPDDDRWVAPPPMMPDTARTRSDMASFNASARVADAAVGAVLDALTANGLAQDTLVIVTTDHGVPLPRMKCSLSDLGTGVMLIVRGPGGFSGGQVCDALVSQIDLFPTVCEIVGVSIPPWVQGRSLLPAVRDGVEVNDAVFSEVTYHVSYEPQRAVRDQRWKYVRQFADRGRPVLPNVDDSPSKVYWVEQGWRDRRVAPEQLYDLVFDPWEADNLVHDPACATVLDSLRHRLDTWMTDTDDPLLRGPVPAPAGVHFPDPDLTSPDD